MASAGLRILVDLTHLWPHGESGGIKPALRETLRWLGRQSDLSFVLLVNPAQDPEAVEWARPNDQVVLLSEAPPDLAHQRQCNLVYCPFGITDWAYPGIPTVTLMVDLLHRDFPESLNAIDIAHRDNCLHTAARRTDVFQVISDYTAQRLQAHTGIDSSRIIRTYLPLQHRLTGPSNPGPRTRENRPYFYYPANAWPHKNHETLLVSYSLYRHATGDDAWRLVLTGHESRRMKQLHQRAVTLGVEDAVDFLGYVDDARLAALWHGAAALVFPSLHEGFGIPLIEAMSRRVPVLANRATAIPEVAGDAALLVDARSPTELAAGLQRIATDERLRLDLVERGTRRAREFQSSLEFGKLLEAFRDLSARPARLWSKGYHEIDGLVERHAVFGLPVSDAPPELILRSRPLGVGRWLEIWNDSECLVRSRIPASTAGTLRVMLPPALKRISLRIPDASRLCDRDPRIHGILLDSLQLNTSADRIHDLLAS